jgi:hypothetical protein
MRAEFRAGGIQQGKYAKQARKRRREARAEGAAKEIG